MATVQFYVNINCGLDGGLLSRTFELRKQIYATAVM